MNVELLSDFILYFCLMFQSLFLPCLCLAVNSQENTEKLERACYYKNIAPGVLICPVPIIYTEMTIYKFIHNV